MRRNSQYLCSAVFPIRKKLGSEVSIVATSYEFTLSKEEHGEKVLTDRSAFSPASHQGLNYDKCTERRRTGVGDDAVLFYS